MAGVDAKAGENYKATKGAIFSSDNAGIMHLGYPEEGHMTTYYPESKGITKVDITNVSKWMEKKGLLVVSFVSGKPFWFLDAVLISSRKTRV